MIAFFPEVYPDELLYSLLARYHARSGYARYIHSAVDIYINPNVHPDVEFINPCTKDVTHWLTKNEPLESVLEQHTMYPAYIRFLPKDRRNEARKAILSCEDNRKKLLYIPKSKEKRYLRYCPLCVSENRQKYGETYWHRAHQVQKIRVCPKHHCFLKNTSIPISSKSSPGLHDAESVIPIDADIHYCDDKTELGFTAFLLEVFQTPIDYVTSFPIGEFLHSKLDDVYVNSSGLVRNMAKIYDDYLAFFGDGVPIMPQSYMQQIFNSSMFDPYFILQIAYFEDVSIHDITHLPVDAPPSGLAKLYQELAIKYRLDTSIVSEIGNAVLLFNTEQRISSRRAGTQANRYNILDEKYLPQVKQIVDEILSHSGRPQKLSFAKVQKRLKIPQKQIFKLPKCKAYIAQHMETQEKYWARELAWAIDELTKQNKQFSLKQIMKLTNMRRDNIVSCCQFITNPKIKDLCERLLK